MKPLKQLEFKAAIVRDLGMVVKGKRKTRRVKLQCNNCDSTFEGTIGNVKGRTVCNRCSRLGANKKLMVLLEQKDYKMRIVKDLGIVNKNNSSHRYAIFECTNCDNEFETRAFAPGSKSQTVCSICWKSGLRGTTHPLYCVWNSIKQRCYNSKRKDYYRYGAKGITLAKEWLDNPIAFIKWCESNGWKKGLVIDKDIKCRELKISPARYSPETISFISNRENAIEANGKTVSKCSLDGNIIEIFSSGTVAAEYASVSKKFMYDLCNTKSEYNGFIYKYFK